VKRNAAHLDAFTAAAASPAFRFEFTAAWNDVIAKAKRIRAEGHVRITHASQGMVIGEVRGDHDTYESGLQRPVGRRQSIQHWACGCPWASFRQDKSAGTRYAGRPCSHVMALQFEAQSRGMFGRHVAPDEALPSWSPPTLVVKSYPPFEGEPHRGRWSEEWRAPVTVPARTGALRESSGAVPEQDCLYRHSGPCPAAETGRTAESLRHRRPRGFWSEHEENPDFDPLSEQTENRSTHVLNGYIGPHHVGTIHYSRSDDGAAHDVDMMHSTRSRTGVASAMMDDLYDHVKRSGGWLNHGLRTRQGNSWWASYREPHPEVSTHNASPAEGWSKYWQPREIAEDMHWNRKSSGGAGAHADRSWNWNDFPEHDRGEEWTHARGYEEPEWGATASLLRGGEDPGEVSALRLLAGLAPVTADQANAPWGSDNTVSHPPAKPYGATSPPDKDMDPGSYGPLAGPDPANWGGIDDGSVMQMPLSNTAVHQVLVPGAAHPVPGDLHWPDLNDLSQDQGTFGYSDRSNAAGPSTAMSPRDPQGIRMEEARGELHDEPEPALPSTTGDDLEATAAADGTIGGGDAGTGESEAAPLDTAALGEFGASARERFRQMFGGPTAMGDQSRAEFPQAQDPSPVGQEPGMGSQDDMLAPDDQSIQTTGNQQWSGGGSDSDEAAVEPGQQHGSIDDIVASFQRSAAALGYSEGAGAPQADGDIAASARAYLSKTADALPKEEADALIREGRGQQARNLGLLDLGGTHYEDDPAPGPDEDDVIFA